MTVPAPEQPPRLTRLMHRLLDPTKRADYLIATLLATWPAVYAFLIGVHETRGDYVGYWDSLQWMVFIPGLPFTLFILRWATNKIVPHADTPAGANAAGIAELAASDEGRRATAASLHAAVYSPRTMAVALSVTVVFHVVDLWMEFLRFYVDRSALPGPEPDWNVMFSLPGDLTWGKNLLLLAFAYPLQFAVVSMLLWFVVAAFRHNVFFLDHVYQRRRVPPGREAEYFVIDLDDANRCFGFRRANEAFNVQVVCLMLAGVGLLFSRFPTVTPAHTKAVYGTLHNLLWFLPPEDGNAMSIAGLLPDFGQWSIATLWGVALLIISLPALVKLLPGLPFVGSAKAQRNITGYLREFLPDTHWPYGASPSTAEVDALAGRFAENAFWPTGNNRARTLFFVSFFVYMVILFPLKPLPGHAGEFIAAYLGMAGLAFACTALAFKVMEWSLSYIDARLVGGSAVAFPSVSGLSSGGIGIGERYAGRIFISYRREDTLPYAGRLQDTLEELCYPERIFRDLETVSGGDDFANAIDGAIAAADAVIVLIGERWLAPDDQGNARLHDPDDWVHLEVAASLQRSELRVIPALVGGATMPRKDQLPEPLKHLSRRNAIEITDSRWDYDVGRLVQAMKAGG